MRRKKKLAPLSYAYVRRYDFVIKQVNKWVEERKYLRDQLLLFRDNIEPGPLEPNFIDKTYEKVPWREVVLDLAERLYGSKEMAREYLKIVEEETVELTFVTEVRLKKNLSYLSPSRKALQLIRGGSSVKPRANR